MKPRNKKTGELVERSSIVTLRYKISSSSSSLVDAEEFDSIEQLNEEWEDYKPVEPIFDERIRRGIMAWWDMQDNPFKAACVMLIGKNKDLDGFYHWRIFGYIREGEQKESTDLCFRTKKLYDYDQNHDYTKEELCGDEEECES